MRIFIKIAGTVLMACQTIAASAQSPSYRDQASYAQAAPAAYQQPAVGQPASSPMPLPAQSANGAKSKSAGGGLQSIITVVGSLAVVLGIFFLVVWLLRRASPHAAGALPLEAFEVLGRAPMTGQQQVQLVRCGTRLLLVAVGHTTGARTLAEITDAAEVDQLVELCQSSHRVGRRTALHRSAGQAEDRDA